MNQPIKDDPSGFSYECYHTTLASNSSDILSHWHPELEIIYVQKGSACYHINHTVFNSQAGDIILIQPNNVHAISQLPYEEQESDTFAIHLDHLGRSNVDKYSQRYLQPIYIHHFELTPRIQPGMPGYEALKSCLLSIFSIVREQNLYFDMLLKSKLHEFLYLVFKHRYVNRHYTDDTYQKYQKLRDLIDYIYQHAHEQLTISELAEYFGYSRTHFMAVFKQHIGRSCLKFIIQVRLNNACDLLVQTRLPVREIAQKVGFTNIANFNRQFKQAYHITPYQYRQKNSPQT
ncbi:helix-turn-helix domain-containing protein [Streptococcus caprae]|uniref:Helix-turn-helix domain-containing protein n=1 Tax=Streptococcus caprae TaxID=1640501 RepID=A0ABV8CUM2_9STRE